MGALSVYWIVGWLGVEYFGLLGCVLVVREGSRVVQLGQLGELVG